MNRLITATAAVAALTLTAAACGGDDEVTPETLTEALVNQGMEEDLASCISTEIYAQVDQDTFNQIAVAQSTADMPDGAMDLITDVTVDCSLGG